MYHLPKFLEPDAIVQVLLSEAAPELIPETSTKQQGFGD